VERLGEVNLAATAQYEELKGRYDLLTAQQEDLDDPSAPCSRPSRRSIGPPENDSARRLRPWISSSQGVSLLFEGGEAHLVLTEAPDVLESGLDIVARPLERSCSPYRSFRW